MLADSIKTLLNANAPLVALMTGGIVTYNELGGQGLSRKSYADAYDATTLVLKPICVIRQGMEQHVSQIQDEGGQALSTRTIMRIVVLQDRQYGYSTLETAQGYIYTSLQGIRVTPYIMNWVQREHDKREFILDNACAVLDTFFAFRVMT